MMSFDTTVFINTDMVFPRVAAQSETTLSSDAHSDILFYEQAWNRRTGVSPSRHSAVYDFKIFFSIDFCNNIMIVWCCDSPSSTYSLNNKSCHADISACLGLVKNQTKANEDASEM